MHIVSIDFLRGLAALAVAWYHFAVSHTGFLDKGLLLDSGEFGWLGYYVFFIISGFVVPYSLHIHRYVIKNYFHFVLRRLVRLEPPYILSIALIIVLQYLSTLSPLYRGQPFSIDPIGVLLHLGYLNVFFDRPWLNPVYWTLAVEFQYYLSVGLLYIFMISKRFAIRGLLYLVLLILFYRFGYLTKFIFCYLPLFMLGFLAFQKKCDYISSWEYIIFSVPLLVLAYPFHPILPLLCCLTVCMILWFQVKWKWGIFLGKISYSLYLLHVPIGGRVVNLMSRFAHTMPEKILTLALAVVLSIAASAIFYNLIEKRAIIWSKHIKYH